MPSLDQALNDYLKSEEYETVTFECEVALALPIDPENATTVNCIATGEYLNDDHETDFIPTSITDKKTGEAYNIDLIVDVCDLCDDAFGATRSERVSANNDDEHDKFRDSQL